MPANWPAIFRIIDLIGITVFVSSYVSISIVTLSPKTLRLALSRARPFRTASVFDGMAERIH